MQKEIDEAETIDASIHPKIEELALEIKEEPLEEISYNEQSSNSPFDEEQFLETNEEDETARKYLSLQNVKYEDEDLGDVFQEYCFKEQYSLETERKLLEDIKQEPEDNGLFMLDRREKQNLENSLKLRFSRDPNTGSYAVRSIIKSEASDFAHEVNSSDCLSNDSLSETEEFYKIKMKHSTKRWVSKIGKQKQLYCDFCKAKDFKEERALEVHLLRYHSDNHKALAMISRDIFKCKICDYQTLLRQNFTRHLTTHEKILDLKSCLDGYIKEALNEPWFCCQHCSYKTRDKGSLKKHVRLHMSYEHFPFVCQECDRRFNEKGTLNAHIVKKHFRNKEYLKTVKTAIYKCDRCQYRDVNKSKVLRHRKARHKVSKKAKNVKNINV